MGFETTELYLYLNLYLENHEVLNMKVILINTKNTQGKKSLTAFNIFETLFHNVLVYHVFLCVPIISQSVLISTYTQNKVDGFYILFQTDSTSSLLLKLKSPLLTVPVF